MTTTTRHTVSTPSAAYDAAEKERKRTRLILGGTEALRQEAREGEGECNVLPREVGETPDEYSVRKGRTYLRNFLKSAIKDHAARVFKNPPQLGDDVPELIRGSEKVPGWLENFDFHGNHMDMWGRSVWETGEAFGITYVLVDKAPRPQDEVVKADEKRNKRRPYAVHLDPECVIEVSPRFVHGVPRINRLRWKRTYIEKKSRWDPGTEKEEIRVYYDGLAEGEKTFPADHSARALYEEQERAVPAEIPAGSIERCARFEVYEVVKDANGKKQEILRPGEEGSGFMKPLTQIPLVPFYFNRTGWMDGRPCHPELEEATLEYFQLRSDHKNSAHKVSPPVIHRSGWSPDEEAGPQRQGQIGAGRYFWSSKPEADMKYVEHTGSSLKVVAEILDDIAKRADELSLRPLMKQTGDVVATDSALRTSQANSEIEGWLIHYRDALERILEFMMLWEGGKEGDGGSVVVNKEGLTLLPGGSFQEVRELRKASEISRKTVLKEAKRYGILHPDTDVDEEIRELEQETPKYGALDLEDALAALEARIKALEGGKGQEKAEEPTVDGEGERDEDVAA